MDDNNNNRQNSDKYSRDSRIKHHWGEDDEIMRIINKRDNSRETREVVDRFELTKPGHMSYQWHKKLEREILLPRSPDEGDRKEIQRIDNHVRRKEECRDTHLGADISRSSATKFH